MNSLRAGVEREKAVKTLKEELGKGVLVVFSNSSGMRSKGGTLTEVIPYCRVGVDYQNFTFFGKTRAIRTISKLDGKLLYDNRENIGQVYDNSDGGWTERRRHLRRTVFGPANADDFAAALSEAVALDQRYVQDQLYQVTRENRYVKLKYAARLLARINLSAEDCSRLAEDGDILAEACSHRVVYAQLQRLNALLWSAGEKVLVERGMQVALAAGSATLPGATSETKENAVRSVKEFWGMTLIEYIKRVADADKDLRGAAAGALRGR